MIRFEIWVTYDKTKVLKFGAKIKDRATYLRFENNEENMEQISNWISNTLKMLEKGKPSEKIQEGGDK